MRFNKGLLAILTLFVIIISATAVSAIDDASDVVSVDEENIDDPTYVENDEGDDTLYDGDDDGADDAVDDENLDVGDNPYRHGEKTPNEKAMEQEAAAANAAGSDNVKHHSSTKVDTSSTGNPIVVLLAAMAIIGTGLVRSRK